MIVSSVPLHFGADFLELGCDVLIVWIQTAGASMTMGGYGVMRASEGILPGLLEKNAEHLRKSILKKIKGRKGF